MIVGALVGAIFGVVFYALRGGGTLLIRDLQTGFGMVIGQAIAHMIVPALIGLGVGAIFS